MTARLAEASHSPKAKKYDAALKNHRYTTTCQTESPRCCPDLPSPPLERLQFIQGPRPVGAQQPRQGPIREHPAARLALRAVIGFVVGVADALHRLATSRARQPIAPMHRHVFTKCGHFFRKALARLHAQPVDPESQRLARRGEQARKFLR